MIQNYANGNYGDVFIDKRILMILRRISMLLENLNFPIDELQDSVKRYVDAKMKTESYSKQLHEEAEKMFPYFVRYAKAEQQQNQTSLPSIIDNFYSDVLGLPCNAQDRFVRSSLTREFKKLLKKHVADDPRYQVKLDEFLKNSLVTRENSCL